MSTAACTAKKATAEFASSSFIPHLKKAYYTESVLFFDSWYPDTWGQSKNTVNPVDCVAVLSGIFTLTPNILPQFIAPSGPDKLKVAKRGR